MGKTLKNRIRRSGLLHDIEGKQGRIHGSKNKVKAEVKVEGKIEQ